MQKTNLKIEPESTSTEDYLKRSLTYATNAHNNAVKQLQGVKREIKELEEDLTKIKSPKLIQACEDVLSKLKKAKTMSLAQIKAAREDVSQIGEIMRRLK